MQIVNININDLKSYDNNPRLNDNAVEPVAKSIQEFGFKVPVVVDRNNHIVCGHTRVKACEMIGIEEVPCIIASDLTDEQIKAFRLVDNKVAEFATWDLEKLDLELNDLDLTEFGFLTTKPQEINWDEVSDLNENEYEEPKHDRLQCPNCSHIDRKIHFKKV